MASRGLFKSSYNLLTKIIFPSWSNAVGINNSKFLMHVGSPVSRYASSQVDKCIMEFFDDEENWSKNEVRVGRSWRKEELRIKSNEDLHKLWFVLLKERNMLLTMEEEYKQNQELFPSPERLHKVKESMVNLEDVVRERNKAYYLLETGTTGERPGKLAVNQLGLNYFYKASEHVVPKEFNRSWWIKRKLWYNRKECEKFLLYYREKLYLEKRKARVRERNHVMGILKRFPNTDLEALKEEFPSVNVERLMKQRKADGHFVRP